ncbi:MAG: glycerophosphodiester phosphodiesterase family protein [Proteobacteria bacterium]|nr:glycerophosphodiester phosphodiesterase family protein [Pseudomonadota bacterium]
MTRAIEIVCHRGANEYAPENTYASAALCIDWQMDYLEIDVNTSRDGVMYVFHGPDLGRTTNDTRKIYESDSHDVDRLDCGAWFGEGFVELSLRGLSREIIEACRAMQMKIMVLQRPFDPVACAAICDWGVDLINVDHGDRFL